MSDSHTTNASSQPIEFTVQDIEKLANLSRLKLTDEEKQSFAKEIGGILAYVGQIQNVVADTAGGISADNIATHRTDKSRYPLRNVMREDIASRDNSEERKIWKDSENIESAKGEKDVQELNPDPTILIESAPRHTDNYIQVKKILGGSQ